MPATSVSTVENYIRAEKPSSFSETVREILQDQEERGRKGEKEGGEKKKGWKEQEEKG